MKTLNPINRNRRDCAQYLGNRGITEKVKKCANYKDVWFIHFDDSDEIETSFVCGSYEPYSGIGLDKMKWDKDFLKSEYQKLRKEHDEMCGIVENKEEVFNTEPLTYKATMAIYDLDKSYVGSVDYCGLAYFWHYDYRHYLRDATQYQRRKVHKTFLELGLALDGSTKKHLDVIKSVLSES
jgi:hypothetical protein